MKSFRNDPADVVVEALAGFGAAHPDRVRVDPAQGLVVRRDAPVPGKVGIVAGGGAGHDPAHHGYVGPGMLDAACSGHVFTSPVPDQILAATRAVDGGAGVLHVVKNYTGDVLNFAMAAELAAEEGIRVETVVVADDVAVPEAGTAGRRGTALTVVVEKVVGAAAEAGADLSRCRDLGQRVVDRGRTMGLALGSCTLPGTAVPTVDLGEDEIEIGVGIHGEPGRRRGSWAEAQELAETLLEPVLAEIDPGTGSGLLVVLNGLGGTPEMELYLMFDQVRRALAERGLRVERSLVGTYLSCLDMAGCSLTLLPLDDDLREAWDAPVATPALCRGG